MIDFDKIRTGDPVVLLKEPYSGMIAHFCMRYPYPDGEQFTAWLNGDTKTEKILIYPEDAVQIVPNRKEKEDNTPTDEKSLSDNIYRIGQRVIITAGTYRGSVGVIKAITPIVGGCLTDYEVALEKDVQGIPGGISTVVREEDLVPAGYAKTLIKGLDVGRFLNRDFMISCAASVYEDAVKAHVSQVIENRCFGGTTLTDWILGEVAKQFADDLAPKYKDEILNKIKAEIAMTVPKDADPNGESFHTMFTSALERCASQYIYDHVNEIGALMHDAMAKAAENISVDTVAGILRRKIDIKQIVRDAFTEDKDGSGSNDNG